MPRRPTILKWAKHTLVAASLASAALWIITIPTIHYARLEAHLFTGRAIISLSEGCITIMRNAYATPQPPRCFIDLPTTPPWNRPPMAWGLWQPHLRTNPRAQLLMLPLWLSMLLTTIPAIILQRNLHRPPPGHCPKCNYNLTGNQSGKCPECGTELMPHAAAVPEKRLEVLAVAGPRSLCSPPVDKLRFQCGK